MITTQAPDIRPATLPELEHLLLRTARKQSATRARHRRGWVLAMAASGLVLVGGAVAAATGALHIADGQTGNTSYSIETHPATAGPEPAGSICLQLRYNSGGPAYGCGDRPTAATPFGLVIADSLDGSSQRVIYGLVASNIATVSVLAENGTHTDTATIEKPNLPGRFFSVVVPNTGRIDLAGYNSSGRQQATVGSLSAPASPPRSQDEARAAGDPAGYAPAVAAPSSFTYHGQPITPADASARGLSCAQNRQGIECYDTLAELNASQTAASRK